MTYELVKEGLEQNRLTRTYLNQSTGTETKTHLIYENSGGRWWGFKDLFKVPYIRTVMAQHILNLFTMGLTLKDILDWCQKEKTLIRGEDPEKYEKLYALVLEKEALASHTADPLKQHLSVATVYVLSDQERVDYFTEEMAEEKLKAWATDMKATAFFLNWHNEHIQKFWTALDKTSRIASKMERSGFRA